MTETAWVRVRNVETGLDADIVRTLLEAADILVQVRGNQIGIYGPSFQGPVMGGGVDIYVPSSQERAALEVLGPAE